MNIRLSLIIESGYSRAVRSVTTTDPDGTITTLISGVDDVTSYILDTIVTAPPATAGPHPTAAEDRAHEEWARAILLPFIVTDRSGEHLMRITASSLPTIVGEMFDFQIEADRTGPVPADLTA